jgi:hypothetical protein
LSSNVWISARLLLSRLLCVQLRDSQLDQLIETPFGSGPDFVSGTDFEPKVKELVHSS